MNLKNMKCTSSAFKHTGLAKIEGIKHKISEIYHKYDCQKVVIFAHHKDILNAIEQHLKDEFGHKCFVRIDGEVDMLIRQKYVEQFQNELPIKFALLSLTAACNGITLTASSTVIFAEQHWQ